MLPLSPATFADLGHRIAARVRACRDGNDPSAETLADPADLKSHHGVDERATTTAREALAGYRCNVYIEGTEAERDPDAAFCVYIDPIDGSLNWDRGIGDPAVVLAAAPGPSATCLDDLALAYVEGLRSGARYTVDEAGAYYRDPTDGHTRAIGCAGPENLADATAYLRCGYGGARAQLERTLALFLAVRDVRAVDNAGMECAEIARGAAHLMVEARGISDGYNLLAYPIARAAGAVLVTLDGRDLGREPFDPGHTWDYVLASNHLLAEAAVTAMHRYRESQMRAITDLENQLMEARGARDNGSGSDSIDERR